MLPFILQFGILFLTIVLVSFLIKGLRQPIIIGYVFSGFVFSFFMKSINLDANAIYMFSELGITFLLFLMGLEFDLRSLKYLGKDIAISTLIQSAVFFGAAFGAASLFPLSLMQKIFFSILFMFSSTLLVAKWLEDRKESTLLQGKIILGTLILQDVIAIAILSAIGTIQEASTIKLFLAPLEGVFLIGLAYVMAKYVLPKPLAFASRFPELLFIFSLGICFFFVLIASLLDFSTTIGAFIAGVTLANTIFKTELLTRLKPLIIFFNMLFFVGLGFQMNTPLTKSMIWFIAAFSLLTLLVKPLINFLTFTMRGFDYKVSFLSAVYLSQLSEFDIIIISAAVSKGILPPESNGIAIILVLISMMISTYAIKYVKRLARIFRKTLAKLAAKGRGSKGKAEFLQISATILFFGYHELGQELYRKLANLGKKILVIENDPENVAKLYQQKIPCLYNSIHNEDFFDNIHFEHVELVVSNLMDREDTMKIIQKLKKSNSQGIAIVTAKNLRDSLILYEHKADYVVCPSYLNEQHVSVLLEDYTTDVNKVIEKKISDITKIRHIQEKSKAEDDSGFIDLKSLFSMLTKRPFKRD
ncbi:cation:proton antiporter [Candidatus Woesearchaeota archaeon]|nr:cation:proton antiporter [Candidatus Woesearchaeota archaeon]